MATIDRGRLTDELTFAPPGPGTWTVDGAHVPRPTTAHLSEVTPDAMFAGFSEGARRYGMLFAGIRTARVHGFSYHCREPLAGHEVPERIAAAVQAFESRLWRDDLRRWDEEVKPATLALHADIRAVDPDALDDGDLAAYVQRCRDHHAAMITQHHRFNMAAMLPVGDFLAHGSEWTGLPAGRLMETLAGASPVSSGDSPERRALLAAIAAEPAAAAALQSAPAGELIATLAGCGPAVTAALASWIALVGDRIVDGFDVCGPRLQERPALLAACLRAATDRTSQDSAAAVAAVRDLVPSEHHATFDELLAEARLVYRLRDERGVYSDITAAGLMRRAMLAAGRRLTDRGVFDHPEQAVEATAAELAGLLTGGAGPSAAELAERAAFRNRWTVADAPPVLGDPPMPPPPFDGLPPLAARATAAMMAFGANMGAGPEQDAGDRLLRGVAVGGGAVTGPARLVRTIDDLDRLEPGDVLVALTTTEAFNMGMALAAAVVTDHGGVLSHTAILARELGIPAVVGTIEATARIPDGAVVTVDGTGGEVRWSS